jgi:hypothetical protein
LERKVAAVACLVDRPGGKAYLLMAFVSCLSCEVEPWGKKGRPLLTGEHP